MSSLELTAGELVDLLQRVFRPRPGDRALAILIDLPDDRLPDTPAWRRRRQIAARWARQLAATASTHGLVVSLVAYRNVRSANADLPEGGWTIEPDDLPGHADQLSPASTVPFERVLTEHQLVLAPTELSATAPLKVLARRLGFRAATMPGFSPAMVPALRLDYGEVDRRVRRLKQLLDRSRAAELEFLVDGRHRLSLRLDLRHRQAHASGGLLHEPGTAGNLPSGEAYVVPYEGELEGDPSASAGELPVELGGEVVVFRIEANRAVEVRTEGPRSAREAQLLADEPARGNLAELGLGVLSELGIRPIGEILLDEKLGLHLAFGRSDHFGGQVGPSRFSRPEAVIHQDHVYLPQLQPRVLAARVTLIPTCGGAVELIRAGSYVIDFSDRDAG